MKFFFIIYISIVILSGTSLPATGQSAVEQPSQEIRTDKPATQKPLPITAPVVQPQSEPKSGKDNNWPRPFVPTERINADSAVSLPTDI